MRKAARVQTIGVVMRHPTAFVRLFLLSLLFCLASLPLFALADEGGAQTHFAAKSDALLAAQSGGLVAEADDGQDAYATRTVRLAVLSDVHYVNPEDVPVEGTAARTHFNHAENAEMRLMSEIDPILVKALDSAVATNPDAMLVSGGLTSNDELANAQKFASRLSEAKGKINGAGIYVVNGNHDMNMSYAAKFSDAGTEAVQRIEQDDWRTIFDGLGYKGGERLHRER